MRIGPAPYSKYLWLAVLTLAVVVVGSTVTIKDDAAAKLPLPAAKFGSDNPSLRSPVVAKDASSGVAQDFQPRFDAAPLLRLFPPRTSELKTASDAQLTAQPVELATPSTNQIGRNSQSASAGFLNLPFEAQASISRVLGRDIPNYQARARGKAFAAENKQNHLSLEFTPAGVEIRSGDALWQLALRSYGYGDALQPLPAATPQASSNRVEYHRGLLTEWYVNGPLGFEQGFTLSERPHYPIGSGLLPFGSGKTAINHRQLTKFLGQPLTIALAASGNLTPVVDQGKTSLTLTRDGRVQLRYGGLTAHDSSGKQLRSWLEVHGGKLLPKVEDAAARYPVVIDPWVQVAKLTASDGHAGDFLGSSVAIEANTVVAGAHTGAPGAAYVFVKPATGWANITETAKLTASDGDPFLGSSVAISGNMAVAVSISGVYVFVKPASGWRNMTETAKLTASDPEGPASLGPCVAIAGNTVVAGNQNATNGAGAAYVWVKPASGWTNAVSGWRVQQIPPGDGENAGQRVLYRTVATRARSAFSTSAPPIILLGSRDLRSFGPLVGPVEMRMRMEQTRCGSVVRVEVAIASTMGSSNAIDET
jgi:hypothetical protein